MDSKLYYRNINTLTYFSSIRSIDTAIESLGILTSTRYLFTVTDSKISFFLADTHETAFKAKAGTKTPTGSGLAVEERTMAQAARVYPQECNWISWALPFAYSSKFSKLPS